MVDHLPSSSPGCIYSSKPKFVNEWRQSVWIESQLKPLIRVPDDGAIDDFSPVELDWNSHQPLIKRNPSKKCPSCQLNRQLSNSGPVSRRQSLRLRAPLIDLNQARDASGRPVMTNEGQEMTTDHRLRRERARHSSAELATLIGPRHSSASLLAPMDDELERRHRSAMRRLQAEAIDQIEQARIVHYQQRHTNLSHRSIDPSPRAQHSTFFDRSISQDAFPRSPPRPHLLSSWVEKKSSKMMGVVRGLKKNWTSARPSKKVSGSSHRENEMRGRGREVEEPVIVEESSSRTYSSLEKMGASGSGKGTGVLKRLSSLGLHSLAR